MRLPPNIGYLTVPSPVGELTIFEEGGAIVAFEYLERPTMIVVAGDARACDRRTAGRRLRPAGPGQDRAARGGRRQVAAVTPGLWQGPGRRQTRRLRLRRAHLRLAGDGGSGARRGVYGAVDRIAAFGNSVIAISRAYSFRSASPTVFALGRVVQRRFLIFLVPFRD